MFVELLGPSVRDSVFNFILNHFTVRVLGQRRHQRLLMKLIKFVIELRYHMLDIYRFFFLIHA